MSFLFLNKTLWLSNLKSRTPMNVKTTAFVLKPSHICYYMICMTVPLKVQGMQIVFGTL